MLHSFASPGLQCQPGLVTAEAEFLTLTCSSLIITMPQPSWHVMVHRRSLKSKISSLSGFLQPLSFLAYKRVAIGHVAWQFHVEFNHRYWAAL